MFINIHTHHPPAQDCWSIQNAHDNFEHLHTLQYYSAGLHPWYLNALTQESEFEKFKLYSNQKNVLAIGECGLDRLCNTTFPLQEKVFIHQIKWANELAKPIIIHCVRAHRQVLILLKEYNNHMPVIFHGFNNQIEIAHSLLKAGHFLSFGKSLFTPKMETVFSKIPAEFIFLETDDSDLSIQAIYQQAAKIKNCSLEKLSAQIQQNAKTVFNSSFLK